MALFFFCLSSITFFLFFFYNSCVCKEFGAVDFYTCIRLVGATWCVQITIIYSCCCCYYLKYFLFFCEFSLWRLVILFACVFLAVYILPVIKVKRAGERRFRRKTNHSTVTNFLYFLFSYFLTVLFFKKRNSLKMMQIK
jgi:hypothetical protein